MTGIAGQFLGGLGFFLAGLHLFRTALKQLTGRHLRCILAKWAGNPLKNAFLGFYAGSLTQSLPVVSSIITSMAGAGMITVRQGIPILSWANPAFGLLIIILFFDIKPAILFMAGITGLLYSSLKPSRLQEFSKVFFGLSLLIYGLSVIQQGIAPLAQTEWFKTYLLYGSQSYILCFLPAVLLTVIVQSTAAVSILVISFNLSGLLEFDQTLLIIYTTNLSISINSWISSQKME